MRTRKISNIVDSNHANEKGNNRVANSRKFTDKELVRVIRLVAAAEYEATQPSSQLAESADNKLAVQVLQDVANEYRVLAGEFLRLLRGLALRDREANVVSQVRT